VCLEALTSATLALEDLGVSAGDGGVNAGFGGDGGDWDGEGKVSCEDEQWQKRVMRVLAPRLPVATGMLSVG